MSAHVSLPNIRKLFVPDPGMVLFDVDLAGADAQVVAWEANDEDLKAAFRAGLDVHSKNAEDMWGTAFTGLPGTIESGPKYKKRKQCKQGVHLTNYGGSAWAMARVLGWTNHEADQFQKRWFAIHPGIKKWHERTQHALNTTKTVHNAFGYRRVYFDRSEEVLPQALAWVPQSTVALVTFYGAEGLEAACPWVEILLQVHDSLVFQAPIAHSNSIDAIKAGLKVVVPYPDPLIIPWGVARSDKSWGDCRKV